MKSKAIGGKQDISIECLHPTRHTIKSKLTKELIQRLWTEINNKISIVDSLLQESDVVSLTDFVSRLITGENWV